MDIAKYIGLYLMKNGFVYLHGLGNLELKRKPARYEGDALHAPEYDVVLTPGGSIDDTLANFIATHEQTSISKAANALRDFSTATRAEMAAGKEVEVPGVGKFVEVNGLTRFVANPHLQHVPPPVPTIRMAKRTEEQPDFSRGSSEQESRSEVAWGRVAMLALLAVAVIAGGIFAYRYFTNVTAPTPVAADSLNNQPVQPTVVVPTPDTAATVAKDSLPPVDNTAATAPASGNWTVILNTYPTRAAADRRVNTLTRNGNQVEVLSKDSGTYMVVLRMPLSYSDTTRMLDSLKAFFNPKGVHLLR